jgi:alpha-tubulin suppressor-like RCC1 family protein
MPKNRLTAMLISALLSFGFAQVVTPSANATEVSSAIQMPGTDHYYQYFGNNVSWQSAHDYAISLTYQGSIGHLANVTSAAENSFISSIGNRGWLGARRDSSQTFRWIDGPEAGQTLTFTSWIQGEPNNCCGGEPFIENQGGSWNDNGGLGQTFGFYVEFEPDPVPVQMPGSTHYYRFVSAEGITWQTAATRASALKFEGLKGHLATIQSADENQFIASLTGGVYSWLGGGYPSGSQKNFQWLVEPDVGNVFTTCSTGTSSCVNNPNSYTNWRTAVGQPDAIGEDRIGIAPNGQWDDFYQSNPMYGYVVEFESMVLPLTQPEITGTPVAGEFVKANLGTYDTGASVSAFEWQISSDNQNWSKLPFNAASFSADQMSFLVSKSDRGKFLRIKALVSNGVISKDFFSSSIELQGDYRYIQPHSSLGYDRLCVIEPTSHNLKCQGPSVSGLSMQAQSVDSSVNTMCAVALSSKVKCWLWGPNYLQDGTPDSEGYVTGISNAVAVSNNYGSTCALIVGGTVKCWGHYGWGILGPNITSDSAIPVTIQGLDNVVQIESGWDHTCALKATGDVYCWGRNDIGQVGVGFTNRMVSVPTKVFGLSKVTSISAERHHSCATTSAGKVWCWGDNAWGQEGIGSAGGFYNVPVEVSSISNARRVYSGSDFNCAISFENKAYCWGANNTRQANPSNSGDLISSPSLLALDNVDSMLLGHGESCAALQTGEIKCWGANQFGGLLTPASGSTYETEVNTFAPKAPLLKSVSSGDGKLTVAFDITDLVSGVSLQARTTEGSSSCISDSTGICVLSNLTNYSNYSVEVRAVSDSGSSNWIRLSKSYLPHTPGLQLWFDDNNVKIDQLTKVNVLDAAPNSTIWIKNGSDPKFGVRTDENGAASTTIWLSKATSAKVIVTSGKLSASKYLYSPRLLQLSSIVKVGKAAKAVVQYAMPGSMIQVQTSDGRTLNFTSANAVNSTIPLTFQSKGAFTFTVKVNGKDQGAGAVVVY